ncbi:hypothetical protein [Oceaniglobus ichthyenteri]|uniref:hypothetical protein n=1 Tax=Oceaniglobus ichthyenteri TaxID=2136177 RepID=UPI000D353FDA|nr:hypothetical protein [Oceaniglobus ichthyenteri]
MARLSRRTALAMGGGALAVAATGGAVNWWRARLPDRAQIDSFYTTSLPAPGGPLNVFHLGHSLVGRDMPAMLAQLARARGVDHRYHSQLGWGTSLREHWYPDLPIQGYETENAHDRYRPALAAVGSGDYDAVIVTEMIELIDALKYHDSGDYLVKWADLARNANPNTQVYLYETWHGLDDPGGFLHRIDADLPTLWEGKLLASDLRGPQPRPIHIIPAGQVMARVARAAEAAPLPGLARREDLFAKTPEGDQDPIHLNDIGAYLVAVTHFAVLYHQSPVGLPTQVNRADGTPALAPSAPAAELIQRLAWDVVTTYPKTGVAG